MNATLPNLRVGEPVRCQAISVFPLFCEADGGVEYRLSNEAIADRSLLVEEISQGGSVPDLLVENKGDTQVLFLEGEELIGAKQNRVLNTSVLIAAHTKTKIPVSCVEQGRWRYKSRYFGSSGSHTPTKLRRALKASVGGSARAKQGHHSDQGAVWKEVGLLHAAFGVTSESGAMSDAFDSYQDRIGEYREQLQYVDGASGVAVAIGDRVISVDVFDKPDTCRKVWDRLLSGCVFDALEAESQPATAQVGDVEQLLNSAAAAPWEQVEAVGAGAEFRADFDNDHASLLQFDSTVVHGSVVAHA